jgi:hypothetical protein
MMSLGYFGYEKYGRINLSIKAISNRGIKTGRWNAESLCPWSQGVSKNKKGVPVLLGYFSTP